MSEEIENLVKTCQRLLNPDDLGYQVQPEARAALFFALDFYFLVTSKVGGGDWFVMARQF